MISRFPRPVSVLSLITNKSVFLGVVVLSVREECYVYEGYVGSAVVLYI